MRATTWLYKPALSKAKNVLDRAATVQYDYYIPSITEDELATFKEFYCLKDSQFINIENTNYTPSPTASPSGKVYNSDWTSITVPTEYYWLSIDRKGGSIYNRSGRKIENLDQLESMVFDLATLAGVKIKPIARRPVILLTQTMRKKLKVTDENNFWYAVDEWIKTNIKAYEEFVKIHRLSNPDRPKGNDGLTSYYMRTTLLTLNHLWPNRTDPVLKKIERLNEEDKKNYPLLYDFYNNDLRNEYRNIMDAKRKAKI